MLLPPTFHWGYATTQPVRLQVAEGGKVSLPSAPPAEVEEFPYVRLYVFQVPLRMRRLTILPTPARNNNNNNNQNQFLK